MEWNKNKGEKNQKDYTQRKQKKRYITQGKKTEK